jgi:hypothetical protein
MHRYEVVIEYVTRSREVKRWTRQVEAGTLKSAVTRGVRDILGAKAAGKLYVTVAEVAHGPAHPDRALPGSGRVVGSEVAPPDA